MEKHNIPRYERRTFDDLTFVVKAMSLSTIIQTARGKVNASQSTHTKTNRRLLKHEERDSGDFSRGIAKLCRCTVVR